MPRRTLNLVPVLAVLLGLGCAATLDPPPPTNAVTVYVPDYGRHASLILPRPEGGLVEYAYGEWEWFAMGNTYLIRAPSVLFMGNQGTLGRRELPDPTQAGEPIEAIVGASKVLSIEVDAGKAAALADKLDASFEARRDTLVYNSDLDLEFVHDPRPYTFFNNSNTVTADWLRELGVDVRGPAYLSRFRLRDANPTPTPPPTAPPSPPAQWI